MKLWESLSLLPLWQIATRDYEMPRTKQKIEITKDEFSKHIACKSISLSSGSASFQGERASQEMCIWCDTCKEPIGNIVRYYTH